MTTYKRITYQKMVEVEFDDSTPLEEGTTLDDVFIELAHEEADRAISSVMPKRIIIDTETLDSTAERIADAPK